MEAAAVRAEMAAMVEPEAAAASGRQATDIAVELGAKAAMVATAAMATAETGLAALESAAEYSITVQLNLAQAE